MAQDPKARLRADALHSGFDAIAFAAPDGTGAAGARLHDFVRKGRHGTMAWLAETAARRAHPRSLWPQVRSIIALGVNYGPEGDPLAILHRKDRAAISVYARNRDYHQIIKGKLKGIAGRFAAASGAQVKVFVDTAPVMEKPLAQAAGLGWQGKHTNIVSRRFGSWLFLGAIFTDAALEPDPPGADHCGACRACLDICPTNAFPAPYQLDARRCISYLTIEHKGHIPAEFRKPIGNRVFGCDDCLAVCPWNKFASLSREARFHARDELQAPDIAGLLTLDDAAFRTLFSGSPVKRTGRDRFLRNVLIAAGNSGQARLAEPVRALLGDPSPLVRAMAVWALAQLLDRDGFATLRACHLPGEADADVRAEWAGA